MTYRSKIRPVFLALSSFALFTAPFALAQTDVTAGAPAPVAAVPAVAPASKSDAELTDEDEKVLQEIRDSLLGEGTTEDHFTRKSQDAFDATHLNPYDDPSYRPPTVFKNIPFVAFEPTRAEDATTTTSTSTTTTETTAEGAGAAVIPQPVTPPARTQVAAPPPAPAAIPASAETRADADDLIHKNPGLIAELLDRSFCVQLKDQHRALTGGCRTNSDLLSVGKLRDVRRRFHLALRALNAPEKEKVKQCEWRYGETPQYVKLKSSAQCGDVAFCLGEVSCTYENTTHDGKRQEIPYYAQVSCHASNDGGKITCGNARDCALDESVDFDLATTQSTAPVSPNRAQHAP